MKRNVAEGKNREKLPRDLTEKVLPVPGPATAKGDGKVRFTPFGVRVSNITLVRRAPECALKEGADIPRPAGSGSTGVSILPVGKRIRIGTLSSLFCFLWFLLVFCPSPVQGKLELELENPNLAKMPIAVPDFVSQGAGALNGRDLARIIKNDLYLTGLFDIVEESPPNLQNPAGPPDFDGWSQTGAQALILGSFQVRGDGLVLEAMLYDVTLKKLELGKRFSGRISDHRTMIHKFGDRVMEKLTNVPGCFTTQIAFVGEGQSRELFSMDFDGHDLRQLTRTGSINLSPEWSPDGRGIIFTSYLNRKPDLWALDFATLRPYAISARPGLNASGRYSPDGKIIALSMSFNGIPKIFTITPQGNIIKMLTTGRGNDISPTWSPDGSAIAYVSDQAGTPQIYIMPANGGEPRRLTLQGNYNTDPKWSPQGDFLALTARIEGRFQICTIRTDGTDLRVLTKSGSNQDPTWSPDGRMIAFQSNRNGKRLIYVMDARGEIQVPVSPVTGKAPAWSRTGR
ncbi:MAG: Tol-Pal system beta propeller repeat protein TolB [Desulfomonilaceae bacterium]